ncbi:MAG: S-layer homology domain-containing protein, partial [Oscillospiraceae bacterium]|nr:S-layer homology domain-containing protein [Oscillospiraceae bacterium]
LTGAASLDWFKIDHPGYDSRAYTQAASLYYNGVETPDHVVLDGDDISFYGYDVPPYADSVFTDLYDVNGVSFVLRPVIMNFHTFSESGFLFNGEFSYVGSKLYYTGYAVILKCGNVAGMLENSPTAANTASLCLYYIDNEEWNPTYFSPGNVTTTRTLISVIKTGINNLDSTPYKIDIDIDSATRAFDVYIDGFLRASISSADVEGGASGSTGFGFYTGYYGHSCQILTRIRFEDTKFDIDRTERETKSTVYFLDVLTGNQIRDPETVEDGLSGQQYRIVQPLIIDTGIPQFMYVLSHNSRGTDTNDDIILTYQTNPLRNTTTLYYTLKAEADISEFTEKKARVNGGEWNNGDVLEPVLVAAEDEIEYKITVYKLVGAQPGGYSEIRDTIPNGLTIDEVSITGVKSNVSIPDTITWKLEGSSNETVVWTVPNDFCPFSVSVKVTADNRPGWGARFENTAIVSIGVGSVLTNTTYHEYAPYKITEQFYMFDEESGLPTTDKLPFPDLVTLFTKYNSNYTMQGLSAEQARMYIFKGYDLGYGSGFQAAESISEVPEVTLHEQEDLDMKIRLYYMPVYVTVHFVDESGNPISTPTSLTEMVQPLSDYYIKNSHFNSIASGSKLWNYYDYKLTEPSDGSHKTLGAMPVYPGAGPVFNSADMDGSKHITLYFTDKQIIKVNFKELNNPHNILHNPMIVFFVDSFDPGTATRPVSGDSLSDDIDLTAAFGKVYQYASVYSINGAPAQTGFPEICSDPCEITLFFRTSYTIIEKFHRDGDAEDEDLTLLPDATSNVFGGGSFNGNPPEAIYNGTQKWNYIGYKADNDSNPLNPGRPSIGSVTGDIVIIYIYELDADYTGDDVTILERWRESENTGNVISPDKDAVYGMNDAYSDSNGKVTAGWEWIGWMLDDDPTVRAIADLPSGDSALAIIRTWHTVTYLYRQKIVVPPDNPGGGGGTPKPDDPIDDTPTPLFPFIADHVAYIIGYPTGDVRPTRNVTRAEVATVFFRLLTDDFRREFWTRDNPYLDVAYSDWFNTAVSVMYNMEVITGYPGNVFRPNGDITRAELAAIASRFAKMMEMDGANSVTFSDIGAHWAESDINYSALIGWVNGYTDGTYRPNQPITRAEFMTLVNRVLERVPETADDLLPNDMINWPDNDKDAWYYLAVQEATNSHEPEFKPKQVPGLDFDYEYWVKMMPNRDWLTLETIWQDTYYTRGR